jgi:hypothetical protein
MVEQPIDNPRIQIPPTDEQMAGETEKAFKAFLVFRGLEGAATVTRAWAAWKEAESGQKVGRKTPDGKFREWSTRFKWKLRRAEHERLERRIRAKAAAENCITIGTNIAKVSNEVLGQVQAISARLDIAGVPAASLKGNEIQKLGTISKSIAALTTAATNGMKLVGDGLHVESITENSALEDLLDEDFEEDLDDVSG